MMRCSIEPRTRKYVKWYGSLSFAKKHKKQILDTGLDAVKAASKKVVHKPGKFLKSKIADTVTNSSDYKTEKPDINPRNVEEINTPLEKKDGILNKSRKVL